MEQMNDKGLSRRQLISRGAGAAALVGLGGGVLAACGSSSSSSAAAATVSASDVAAATGTVKVLGWQFYRADKGYDTGPVKSRWSYLAAQPDIWTKSRPKHTFDVLNSGNVAMQQLFALGRLAPLDTALLKNYTSIVGSIRDDAVWRGPDGKVYAIPLAIAAAQPAWDAARVDEPTSLEDLLKPEYKGKIGLLDDTSPIMLVARLLGVEQPGSLSKAQLKEAVAFLEKLKPQVKTVYQFGEEAQLFARGDISVALPSYGSVIAASSKNGAKVKANYLGSFSLVDSWSVLDDGNMAAGLSWIDQTISNAGQRAMAAASGQTPVVEAVADAAGTGSLADVVKQAPILASTPLAANAKGGQASYEELAQAWNQYKASLA